MKRIANLDDLLDSADVNSSVIELDNFIGEVCEYGVEMDKLTNQQKVFYLNQTLEREVNNGGFDLYFTNSGGDNAHETILSLKAIGANKTAEILQKAIDLVLLLIEKAEEVPGDVWDELDEEFFQYQDDLNTLNIEYVKNNRDYF